MTTICLNMIVRDDAHIIRRCLESVKPFVDYWVIVDTGSSDDTRDVIRDCMKAIPGELHERPWKDSGHNRTETLRLADDKADYNLFMDSDEEFLAGSGFDPERLTQDAYQTLHRAPDYGFSFWRVQFVRNVPGWRFEGVVHEYINRDKPFDPATLDQVVTIKHGDAFRNEEDMRGKFLNDAALLARVLEENPDSTRDAFYLAQSYMAAGEHNKALDAYRRRAQMGGAELEAWFSLYQVANALEQLEAPEHEIVDAYLCAWQARPTRAEPLTQLARLYRHKDQYAPAWLFARKAANTARPGDRFFVDESVYAWRALDEYAIAAYYVGEIARARDANDTLLAEGRLPEDQVERIRTNLGFCTEALAEAAETQNE